MALSGLLSVAGRKSTGPSLMSTQLGDIAGGALHSVIGILAAVNYRELSGKGQYVDISMMDTIIPMNTFEGASFLLDGNKREREGFELNGKGIYDIYETSDKEYITVGSLEPKFLKKLAEAVGLPELIDKGPTPNDGGLLKARLVEIIKSKPLAHWNQVFGDLDACIEPVLDFEQAFNHEPQIKAREMIVEVDAGKKKVRQFAMPIKFSESDVIYKYAGREIGHDTQDILKKLGYSDQDIAGMDSEDVFK